LEVHWKNSSQAPIDLISGSARFGLIFSRTIERDHLKLADAPQNEWNGWQRTNNRWKYEILIGNPSFF